MLPLCYVRVLVAESQVARCGPFAFVSLAPRRGRLALEPPRFSICAFLLIVERAICGFHCFVRFRTLTCEGTFCISQ